MDEAEWLKCEEPDVMILFHHDLLTSRKSRLFLCGCLRRVWDILPQSSYRRAIETAERFVDALASPDDLELARKAAHDTYHGVGDVIEDHGALTANSLCSLREMSLFCVDGVAAIAAEANEDAALSWDTEYLRERASQCQYLRDIFGNPFRFAVIDPVWQTSTVVSLSRSAYSERVLPSGVLDSTRLSVLADALEDAGCDNAELLGHLRGPGPHVRGCWAVDLLLGKE